MSPPIHPDHERLEENIGKLMSSTQPTLTMPEQSKARVLAALLGQPSAEADEPEVQMETIHAQAPGQTFARPVPDVPTDLADGFSRGIRPNLHPLNRRHLAARFIEMARRRTIRWSALAATITIAFVGVGSWLKPDRGKAGLAFADVVQHFINASTAKYTVSIELEGQDPVTFEKKQDFESARKALGRPWDNSGPMGIQMLPHDWSNSLGASDPTSEAFQGKTLYFFGQADGQGMQDFFQVMGEAYKQSRADLGTQEIDGQTAVGFHFERDGTAYGIWANAATGLPLRIDITNPRLLGQGKIALSDFEFDVEIPTPQMGMGGVMRSKEWKYSCDENDLINALRRWGKRHDGRLPKRLTHQAWFFDTPDYFRNPNLSTERKQECFLLLTRVIVRGLVFASQLPPGNNWKYFGQGMTLDPNDDQTPICWYQPEGSPTYRVIYRNLSVRDAAPDQLPPTPVAR